MFLAVVPTAVFAVWFGYIGVWVVLFIFMNIRKRRRECGKGMKPAISSGNYEMVTLKCKIDLDQLIYTFTAPDVFRMVGGDFFCCYVQIYSM